MLKLQIISILLIQLFVGVAFSQWTNNPAENTPICVKIFPQAYPAVVSDGSGGAIIVWCDLGADGGDIYAQRVDSSGFILWQTNGISICNASDLQYYPQSVSDGNGGAIVTWQDRRNGAFHIYAQKVNGNGVVQWDSNGVAICTGRVGQDLPRIVSDGSGGAIIAWEDGTPYNLYAQRVDASGNLLWTTDGLAISTAAGNQYYPMMISDNVGGAIITWADFRNGTDLNIYAQRINRSGEVQWLADGTPITDSSASESFPIIASDSASGAIIAWTDYRSNTSYDIYAQRIDSSGILKWTHHGVALCTAPKDQDYCMIASDGANGAVVVWRDFRNNTVYDIYAQRVNSLGDVQWDTNGIAIRSLSQNSYLPSIIGDGTGNTIMTWTDWRVPSSPDIYAQKVNASGIPQWTANGAAISTATGQQAWGAIGGHVTTPIVSDGKGGAIITWWDGRAIATNENDIYAQRVLRNGSLAGISNAAEDGTTTPLKFTLSQNFPNPFNPTTTISYQLQTRSSVTLKIFDLLGREVATLVNGVEEPGYKTINFNANELPGGVYYYRLQARPTDGGQAGNFTSVKKLLLLK
ncbi:MAG: T9SS type A sorting domain-containing protein [Ignavibacteriales bacterium]|nr:T9SS type A sorting domain-containing protein [Ignavibacteriales bacterium]